MNGFWEEIISDLQTITRTLAAHNACRTRSAVDADLDVQTQSVSFLPENRQEMQRHTTDLHSVLLVGFWQTACYHIAIRYGLKRIKKKTIK